MAHFKGDGLVKRSTVWKFTMSKATYEDTISLGKLVFITEKKYWVVGKVMSILFFFTKMRHELFRQPNGSKALWFLSPTLPRTQTRFLVPVARFTSSATYLFTHYHLIKPLKDVSMWYCLHKCECGYPFSLAHRKIIFSRNGHSVFSHPTCSSNEVTLASLPLSSERWGLWWNLGEFVTKVKVMLWLLPSQP